MNRGLPFADLGLDQYHPIFLLFSSNIPKPMILAKASARFGGVIFTIFGFSNLGWVG